jgi:hypothetical protein
MAGSKLGDMVPSPALRPPGWRVSFLLGALVALGAGVRLWSLGFGLPHTQARPDETYIMGVTLAFLRGDRPPAAYDYPWLYPALLAVAYLGYFLWGWAAGMFASVSELVASWPTHWEPFFLINRGVSAAFGAATVAVVFRIGRRAWGDASGLVAALFMALAYLHVLNSHFGTTDVTMTFFVMLAVALLLEADLTNQPRLLVWAGIWGGLAAATKYNAVVLGAPMLATLVLHALAQPEGRARAVLMRGALALGGPFVAIVILAMPFLFFDFERFQSAIGMLTHSMSVGFGPDLGLSRGWLHHLELSLRHGLGIPLLVAGLLGAVAIAAREPRKATVLLSFPVLYYALAGASRNQFFRYALPVVPFLCLTAARTTDLAAAAMARRLAPGRRAAGLGIVAVLAAGIVAPSAASVWQSDRILGQVDNRVVIARWFAKNVPPGSSVLQSGSHYGHVQFERRLGYREWTWNRNRFVFVLDGKIPADRPEWILLQESPLPSATQPIVAEFLAEGYALAGRFVAMPPDPKRVFDQQDAFFVPFAGFENVRRPGPNFSLYRLRPDQID